MKLASLLLAFWVCLCPTLAHPADVPLRFAIVGLVHDHARGFIPSARSRQDMQLAAIVEPNQQLARSYGERYHLEPGLFYTNLEEMLDKAKVQAVATFTSTYDHTTVVETCAARGVHVMMEKPLAVNMEHARRIKAAADKAGIHVLVNYETTWYPANHEAYALIHEKNTIGELRKIVVHDGHQGPREIGCSEDFLQWLTDPRLNGGGALYDFGCYGADLVTWLMRGERPIAVSAVAQQIKPQIYPLVDDEATIVLIYPRAQAIIQASWNWPYNRKDMEIYGQSGCLVLPRSDQIRIRRDASKETELPVSPLTGANRDPLSYLAAVVRGELRPAGLSSLELNLIATEILDAARQSVRTGKRVDLGH
ncbi:MAG: Gfo/Idh/MocA family oxidoreductase [Verrucomicrobiota bacterium]